METEPVAVLAECLASIVFFKRPIQLLLRRFAYNLSIARI
jgi:hypothetical protein